MPLFLLANWKWLAGVAGMAVLAILLGLSRMEVGSLKLAAAKTALDIEKQKTEAATILAAAEKHAREVEEKNAELNIQLEKDSANAQVAIDKALSDNRALGARIGVLLNAPAKRRACGADNVPEGSDAAGGSASAAASGQLPNPVERLIAGATELFGESDTAAKVGIICNAFANRKP